MSNVNYNYLYYFHCIASEGSITAAAVKLDLSPSTLSEHLRQLEKNFNLQLFERKKSRLILNDAGRRMFRYTRVMFKAGQRLIHAVTPKKLKERVTVDIGISSSVSRSFAVDCLSPLFGEDETHVRVKQGDYDYLIGDLLTAQLDLLISDHKPDLSADKGIVSELVQKAPLQVVTAAKNASFAKAYVEQASEFPFLQYSTNVNYRWEIDRYFDQLGVEPNVIGELDDVLLMKNSILRGIGFAVLPGNIIAAEMKSKQIILLDTIPNVESKVFVSYHKKDPLEHVLRVLKKLRPSAKGKS